MRPARGPAGGPEQPADQPVGCHADSGRDRGRKQEAACCPGQYPADPDSGIAGDYLRGHPEDAARFGAHKKWLAALHGNGGDYTRAKTELIQKLTDNARAGRGHPPTPV
jgi:GrpB protein